MRQIFFSLFQSDIYSEINNAQCFFLPSTPTPSLLLPCRRSGYSSYHPLFQALQIKELRRSTLQTLQYVLRAQHFKFFPFTKLPSSALPTLDIDSLSELNYMKRLMMNEDHSSPSLSSSELQAFRKIHLRTLRVASYSQLETEGLFYLDMMYDAFSASV